MISIFYFYIIPILYFSFEELFGNVIQFDINEYTLNFIEYSAENPFSRSQ